VSNMTRIWIPIAFTTSNRRASGRSCCSGAWSGHADPSLGGLRSRARREGKVDVG